MLHSTAAQIYLAKTASLDSFRNVRFAHHPLLADFTGEKLSKSAGSVAIKNHYHSGHSRELFFRRFCRWIGAEEEEASLKDILPILPVNFFGGR